MRVCGNRRRFTMNFVIRYKTVGRRLLPRLGMALFKYEAVGKHYVFLHCYTEAADFRSLRRCLVRQ